MNIHTFPNNPIEENTYVVGFEDGRAVIIDCGALFPDEKKRITDYIRSHGYTPVAHLLTHGHFDHCLGSRYVWETFGVKPVVSADDAGLFLRHGKELRQWIGMDYPEEPFTEYIPLEEYDLSSIHCQSFFTPGHTRGGVCYLIGEGGEKALFSGDTLFRGSVGRTDLEGGDMLQLLNSIRSNLFTLPDDLTVFPGHGPRTTIGFEKRYNMYMQ